LQSSKKGSIGVVHEEYGGREVICVPKSELHRNQYQEHPPRSRADKLVDKVPGTTNTLY
jgi:hypothetical protein